MVPGLDLGLYFLVAKTTAVGAVQIFRVSHTLRYIKNYTIWIHATTKVSFVTPRCHSHDLASPYLTNKLVIKFDHNK